MKFKIFNIGKANAEIERLEKELAALKSSPAGDPAQLSEALASNEEISNQLSQANSDLAESRKNVSTLTANLEKSQGEVNAIGGALNAACTSLNLEIKDGATSAEMISALKNGVSGTLAKLNVEPGKIPAAKPAVSPEAESKTKSRANFLQLSPAAQLAFVNSGGKITD